MNVSPLIEQDVLALLSASTQPYERLNFSQIARQRGVHQSSVTRIVQRLVHEGVIEQRRIGWYRLAVEDFSSPERSSLQEILRTQKEILERLRIIEEKIGSLSIPPVREDVPAEEAQSQASPVREEEPKVTPEADPACRDLFSEAVDTPDPALESSENLENLSWEERTIREIGAPAKHAIRDRWAAEKVCELYRDALPSLPQLVSLDTGRGQRVAASIDARWEEARKAGLFPKFTQNEGLAGLLFFRDFFTKVSRTPFLLGKSRGAAREWRADLEWLMSKSGFWRVQEGRYAEEGEIDPLDRLGMILFSDSDREIARSIVSNHTEERVKQVCSDLIADGIPPYPTHVIKRLGDMNHVAVIDLIRSADPTIDDQLRDMGLLDTSDFAESIRRAQELAIKHRVPSPPHIIHGTAHREPIHG